MVQKIEVGSQVQYTLGISTGAAIMTVEELQGENPVMAKCSWKVKGELLHDTFHVEDLTLVNPKGPRIVPTTGL